MSGSFAQKVVLDVPGFKMTVVSRHRADMDNTASRRLATATTTNMDELNTAETNVAPENLNIEFITED